MDGYIKAGKDRYGNQRYKNKETGERTISNEDRKRPSKSIKDKAIEMYLDGACLRFIGRTLGYSHVSVFNWVKDRGESLKGLIIEEVMNSDEVELDEMWHFIGSKKK